MPLLRLYMPQFRDPSRIGERSTEIKLSESKSALPFKNNLKLRFLKQFAFFFFFWLALNNYKLVKNVAIQQWALDDLSAK